jgi:hypothetical protein
MLSEALASTIGATYTSALACDNGVTPSPSTGTTGSFNVPTTLAGATITCTFTNTRTEALLTLQKAWDNGFAGDQAGLSITGSDGATRGAATSTATGAVGLETDTTNVATATVFSGETVALNEELPPAGVTNTGAYLSSIACDQPGLTPGTSGQGGTFAVPSTPVPVTCTITNTRTPTGVLTLEKTWVNGHPNDSATLTVTSLLGGTETATAVVPAGGQGTSANKVEQHPITAGETINLSEVLAANNIGTYSSTLTCDQPGLVENLGGQSGTFTVSSNTEAVLCTFTNTSPAPEPTVKKTVVSNNQNPDGTWTTVYDLAVTNPDPNRSTMFTLSDTLAFGANITVNSATVTGPAPPATGPAPSPTWNGTTDTTVVPSAFIAAGTTLHYTVTVNSTVHAAATADDRLCASGGGFRNTGTAGLPSHPDTNVSDTACADPASPTVTKRVVSVVAGASPGQFTVTYALTVANSSTTSQVSYSLNDELGFPAGVTITSTSASRVHSALDGSGATAPQPVSGWTGSGSGTQLASNMTLAAQSMDTYTLVVGVTVTSSVATDALMCNSSAGAGHGYFNSATMTSGSDQFTAEACADITPVTAPPAPSPPPPAAVTPSAPAAPLAFTGFLLSHFLIAAALLLALGTALIVISRRRRTRARHGA